MGKILQHQLQLCAFQGMVLYLFHIWIHICTFALQLHNHGLNPLMITNIPEENTCIYTECVQMAFPVISPNSAVYNLYTEHRHGLRYYMWHMRDLKYTGGGITQSYVQTDL